VIRRAAHIAGLVFVCLCLCPPRSSAVAGGSPSGGPAPSEPAVRPLSIESFGPTGELTRREQAVGHRDAQHRRVALDVEAVAQAQRAELVLGELAGEEAPRLVAVLRDPLVDDLLVVGVVAVHDADPRVSSYS